MSSTTAQPLDAALHCRDLFLFEADDGARRVVIAVPYEESIPSIADQLGASATPTRLSPVATWCKWSASHPPSLGDMREAYGHLAQLRGMNVPLVNSLVKVASVCTSLPLQRALLCVAGEIERGSAAAAAFGRHPRIFDAAAVGQIAAGERIAKLQDSFESLARYTASLEKVQSQATMAAIYPLGVVSVLYLIVSGILYFVMPKLAEAFKALGVKLPFVTTLLLELSAAVVRAPLLLLVPMIVAFVALLFRAEVAPIAFGLIRRLPVFGRIYLRAQMARNVATLAALLSNKIPLHEALGLIASGSSDKVIREAFSATQHKVEAGIDAPKAFTPIYRLFGKLSVNLRAAVDVGFSSSDMPRSLSAAAANYQADFMRANEVLTKLMEPAVTVVIGMVVGGIVIAAYYPILTASQHIK